MNPAAHGTNWIPGLLALAAAAVAALAFLFGSRKLKNDAPSTGSYDDLNTRYQARLAALKDHRTHQHLLDPAEYEATRRRLEQEAAAILRERDGVKHEKRKAEGRAETRTAAQARDDSYFARNPALAGGLMGAAVVGFFVLLGFTLTNAASERTEGMQATGMVPPGGGGPMQGPGQGQPQEDPKLAAAARRVESAPDDPDALADLALLVLRRQGFDDARPLVDRLAVVDPFHVRGRIARAVLRAVDGEPVASEDDLEHLAAFYPEAYEARLFAGLIAMDDNPARAATNFEAYAATAPRAEQPPMIPMMIQQARQRMAGPR